jgi:hypothetical protein
VEKELPINGKLFNESKLPVVDRGIKTGDVKETFYHNKQGTLTETNLSTRQESSEL